MTSSESRITKGAGAEETLREYFLSLGYYVTRSATLTYDNVDITDIDLWLYGRPSAVTRERVNVDIKNKRTPQAIERILWAAGLRVLLGLDRCIVATTDKRPTVGEFGRDYGVMVIDGRFLQTLRIRNSGVGRLADEELVARVADTVKGTDLVRRMREGKSRLLTHLNFDGCNRWLEDLYWMFNSTLAAQRDRAAFVRATYIAIGQFLIATDFVMANIAFAEPERRQEYLREGFLHGSEGRARTEAIANLFSTLTESSASQVKKSLLDSANALPVDILVEYFGKNSVASLLFRQAREFDSAAYAREVLPPHQLSVELRSTISVLLDFLGIDRVAYFNAGPTYDRLIQ